MKLFVISFGRLKTPGMQAAADYYTKLLQPWTQLESIELKPLELRDKTPAERLRVQTGEAKILSERFKNILSARGKYWILDETGKSMRTLEWSQKLRDTQDDATPELALLIGSSVGFHSSIRERASASFSLGPQTMPHELARVVLLEQVYRAWSVLKGHPYHNEGM